MKDKGKSAPRPLPFGRKKGKGKRKKCPTHSPSPLEGKREKEKGKSAQPTAPPLWKEKGKRKKFTRPPLQNHAYIWGQVGLFTFQFSRQKCGCVNAWMRECVPRPTAPMETHYGGKDVGPFHFSRLFDHGRVIPCSFGAWRVIASRSI